MVPNVPALSRIWQAIYICLSFVLVAWGQPDSSAPLDLAAAAIGYALFWRTMWCRPTLKQQFLLATLWFTSVQLVQLFWFTSHPYSYIYIVYLFFSIAIGLQFGCVSFLVTPQRIMRFRQVFIVAAAWTLMEWLRLFFFTGFTFGPVGLALSGNIYTLQMASLWGIYGMSFYVIFTNLVTLRGWLWWQQRTMTTSKQRFLPPIIAIFIVSLPYIYGMINLSIRKVNIDDNSPTFDVLLVQTGFPVEELIEFKDSFSSVHYVTEEWRQILHTLSKYKGKHIDLIVLPEAVVPYSTYYAVYPYGEVRKAFRDILGPESLSSLPPLMEHLAMSVRTEKGSVVMVNNAFWVQAIANLFHTGVVAGLEDREEITPQETRTYNAAMTFFPGVGAPQRYEKRVLLPLGEYMPFSFFKSLVASYGVGSGFTSGTEAKLLSGTKVPVALSICYEETFGHLMRENRLIGGQILVNISSDVWYPNSKLPQKHFDLARLRTVENGMPLARSCSTGRTGAVDSLGRIIKVLENKGVDPENNCEAVFVKVPLYTYTTPYTHTGDDLIIGACWLVIIAAFGSQQLMGGKKQE